MPIPLPDFPCYLDGHYTTVDQARVSVLDRGFIFGDGIYEVVPVYGGRLFRVDEHLARLDRNLGKIRIPNPHAAAQWLGILRELIARDGQRGAGVDLLAYIQVTRGVALRDHVMPSDIVPTVFAMVSPMKPPTPEQRHHGVACVTARDFRWERGSIKTTSLLGNVLARQISADGGAAETILFRDGPAGGPWLTEAAASNVWVVKEGALLGPPRSEHVLEGIRYGLFQELCEDEGIPFSLRPISEAEVLAADELLLSSATKEVLAVTRLDGEPVGHGAGKGKPGPVFARLYAAYQRAKASESL